MADEMFQFTSEGIVDMRPSFDRIQESLGNKDYDVSKESAAAYAQWQWVQKPRVIKALMMCKNEGELLRAWIAHHGALLGHYNLIVLDNGSTDELTKTILREAEEAGAQIVYGFASAHDFISKGEHAKSIIQMLDHYAPADFYFPMDCDEFLVVEKAPHVLDFTRRALLRALAQFDRSDDLLVIGSSYDNHLVAAGHFHRHDAPRKVFFARGGCVALDHGFHHGSSPSGKEVKTSISYLHFHYREVEAYKKACEAKLRPFMEAYGVYDLHEFRARELPGHHLTGTILNEGSYASLTWAVDPKTHIEGVSEHFASLGVPEPYKGSQAIG